MPSNGSPSAWVREHASTGCRFSLTQNLSLPSLYNWADIIYDLHTVGYNWADIIQYIYNYTIGQISYDIYNWADMIQLGRHKTWDIDSRFLSDVNVKLPLSITSMSSGPSSINGQTILLLKSIVLEKE